LPVAFVPPNEPREGADEVAGPRCADEEGPGSCGDPARWVLLLGEPAQFPIGVEKVVTMFAMNTSLRVE
jgi:hypothetical protein